MSVEIGRQKVARTWVLAYLISIFWLIILSSPFDYYPNWVSHLLAVFCIFFGAIRLATLQVRRGIRFIYGCLSILLFVPSFLGMYKFSLWLYYQAPSTLMINIGWITGSLTLGGICASFPTQPETLPPDKAK